MRGTVNSTARSSAPCASRSIDRPARDSRDPGASRPCRRPRRPRRRACGRAGDARPPRARRRGWCGRRRRRARSRAAECRRAPGRRPRRGPRRGAPGRAASRARVRCAFAAWSPTSSEPTSPGPCVTATPRGPRSRVRLSAERRLDHRHDRLEVVACGELGHDAAVGGVHARPGWRTTFERMSAPVRRPRRPRSRRRTSRSPAPGRAGSPASSYSAAPAKQ